MLVSRTPPVNIFTFSFSFHRFIPDSIPDGFLAKRLVPTQQVYDSP
jgi:hypothetical protein